MRSPLRVLCAAGFAVIFGLLLTANAALAECDPETALFEDDFEFLDGSWIPADDSFYVEDGVLRIKGFKDVVNFATQNDAANVCIDMTIVDAPAPDTSPIGLNFWWQDWDNYYVLYYWADDAYVEVRRYVKGKSQTLVSLETLALKKGVGQTNHIELQLRPKDATLFINGTEVTRFKGKPPKDGGPIGVRGSSPEDKPALFQFDNLVVSPPAE